MNKVIVQHERKCMISVHSGLCQPRCCWELSMWLPDLTPKFHDERVSFSVLYYYVLILAIPFFCTLSTL